MADGDFLQSYLESLERKDSREGATKWLLLVAIAGLSWKLLELISLANLRLSVEFAALLQVLSLLVLLAKPESDDGTADASVRFLSGKVRGRAQIKQLFLQVVSMLLTGAAIFWLFDGVSDISRYMLLVPIGVLTVAVAALLLEKYKEYEVKKPFKLGPGAIVFMVFFFVSPMLYGTYTLLRDFDALGKVLNPDNGSAVKAAFLIFAIIFLLSKYAKTFTTDSEIDAIRKVWKRRGLGELTVAQADDELRLIVAGATLSEAVSIELSELSKEIDRQKELEQTAEKELERVSVAVDQKDAVALEALRNSLKKRREDLDGGLSSIEGRRDKLFGRIKKLLGDEDYSKNSESLGIQATVESKVADRRSALTQLFQHS